MNRSWLVAQDFKPARHSAMSALRWAACGFVSLAVGASAQQPQTWETLPQNVWVDRPPEPLNDWPRHFRVGMLVGFNVNASFSMNGQFSVSGSNPGDAGVSGQNHFYDDGYVLRDATGNALGRTSFWGYDQPSQYNPTAQTLTFHSAESFQANASAKVEGAPSFGFDLAYGGRLAHWGAARINWEFGFGLLPISIKDTATIPGTVSRKIHTFSTEGILLPTAPYHGGSSGIGPTIKDVATDVSDLSSSVGDTGPGTITGSRTLDTTLYVFRLGPLVHWELSPRWAVSASAGPAVGLVNGDLKYDELVQAGNTSGINTGSVGGSDWVFGGYVGATVMYHAVPNGDIYLGVQYMPLGTAQIGGGGREAKLDLSGGVYISAGINWPF